MASLVTSSYCPPSTVSAGKVIIGSLGVSRLIAREFSRGEGPGPMGRECTGSRDLVGSVGSGGSSGWVESGGKPNTESTKNPSPMARNLTTAGLSNTESGGPRAAIKNFVGGKL